MEGTTAAGGVGVFLSAEIADGGVGVSLAGVAADDVSALWGDVTVMVLAPEDGDDIEETAADNVGRLGLDLCNITGAEVTLADAVP